MVGLFSANENAQAEVDPAPLGTCRLTITTGTKIDILRLTETRCKAYPNYMHWKESTLAEYEASVAQNNTAATTNVNGTCMISGSDIDTQFLPNLSRAQCTTEGSKPENIKHGVAWRPDDGSTTITIKQAAAGAVIPIDQQSPGMTAGAKSTADNEFQQQIDESCGGDIWNWTLSGCLLKIFYYTYFQVPTLLLWIAAYFFNALVNIGISSSITSQMEFIPNAWAVIRDLSNMFFILILLYVAIQMILGMGHDSKKMIAQVIIMALLINFSMFFTKIVIDTSNVLALVFYSKIDTKTKEANGKEREYTSSTPNKEKDISGALYKNFDATQLVSKDTIDKFKETTINGEIVREEKLPFALTMGIMFVAGSIMLVAAYTFFVAGFMFLGRLVELWILMIFSPFAFMSFALPLLSNIEYIGWKAWSDRLLKTCFMAPIFMFFLYVIFKLLGTKGFFSKFTDGTGAIATLLGTLIPAMIILALLDKATKYAEKGGGQFGEALMKGAKALGGMASTAVLGAATGGAAVLGRATLGRTGAAIANSERARRWEREGKFGSTFLRSGAKAVGSASFDVRAAKIGGQTLAGATGLQMGKAGTGGFTERKKEEVEKRRKRADELHVQEGDPLKQTLNTAEADLQELLNQTHSTFAQIDRDLERQRKKKSDFKRDTPEYDTAVAEIKRLRDEKTRIMQTTTVRGGINNGKTMEQMEDEVVPEAKHAIEHADRASDRTYAQTQQTGWERAKGYVLSGGAYTESASREAAHKIIMQAKISGSGSKGGDGGHTAPAAATHAPAAPAPATTPAGGGHGGGGHS